jgi:hypothetical protein
MSGPLVFAFTGTEQMMKRLEGLQFSPDDLASAVFEEARLVERNARKRTPWATGNLARSYETTEPAVTDTGVKLAECRVINHAAYAFWVHEIPAAHRVGEDHFLLNACHEQSKGMGSRIVKRVKAKGGGA